MTKTTNITKTGMGLAAVAALGTYLLYGKRGAVNREKVSGWMLKMKGEVLDRVEGIKDLNKEAYYTIVDETAVRYARLERVGASELQHLTQELKGAWEHLGKQLK